MKLEPLSDVATIVAGQSPPSKFYNSSGEGLPFFQGKADFGDLHPRVRIWCSNPSKTAEAGDILLSVRAPVGPTNVADERCCIGRGLSAIRPKDQLNRNYLLYYLRSVEDKWSAYVRGSTFEAITQADIKTLQIPLPPLEQQKRIAAILDKADELRAKRRRAIAKLDGLMKSVFLEMFGDPVTNPKGWVIGSTIDVCDCIVPGRDKPKSFSGDTPWITTEDLLHLGSTTKSNKALGLTQEEINVVRARVIPAGSVLLTCVGDLGVISIAGRDVVVNQQLHSFQCGPEINNLFLMHCLSYQTAYMYKRATSTTVPYMNKSVCNSIPILLPPVELQSKFADVVDKMELERQSHLLGENQLDTLFATLQARAFSGDLAPDVLEEAVSEAGAVQEALF